MRTIDRAANYKRLSAEEEGEAVERWKGGDRMAREAVARHLLRFAARYVLRNARGRHDPEELFGWAQCGVVTAMDKYDPSVGVRLTTYAQDWIMNSVNRGRLHSNPVWVPEKQWRKVMQSQADASEDARRALRTPQTLDWEEDGERHAHGGDTPEEEYLREETLAHVRAVVSRVSQRRAGGPRRAAALEQMRTDATGSRSEVCRRHGVSRENMRQGMMAIASELRPMLRAYI